MVIERTELDDDPTVVHLDQVAVEEERDGERVLAQKPPTKGPEAVEGMDRLLVAAAPPAATAANHHRQFGLVVRTTTATAAAAIEPRPQGGAAA